jgi:hypothetical protein
LPETLDTLKEIIRNAIGRVCCDMLQNVWQGTEYWFEGCKALNGVCIEFQ